jgi:hypothetical protein
MVRERKRETGRDEEGEMLIILNSAVLNIESYPNLNKTFKSK